MAESSASRNARAGAQEGALKAIDISEAEVPASRRSTVQRGQPKVVPLYQRTYVRPGRMFAPPVPPARHVLMAMTGGALVFFVAGGRFEEVLKRARGLPIDDQETLGGPFRTLLGWGVMITILVFMADTGVLAPLAISFSWLIFLMILMLYGQRAAERIGGLFGSVEEEPPIELHLPNTSTEGATVAP